MADRLIDLNVAIIEVTAPFACAFKPQFAHYAALGAEHVLAETCAYIKQRHPSIPVLLDAKRGDIGSTACKYAYEAFERYGADGVTVNPYMGQDSIEPFLAYQDKATIVLIKTSNPSSADIQDLLLANNETLFMHLATQLVTAYPKNNLWFVVGATHSAAIKHLRTRCPNTTFLVPGIGAQGGSIADVIKYGMRRDKLGLVINVSRGITAPDQPFSTVTEYLTLIEKHAHHFYHSIKAEYLKWQLEEPQKCATPLEKFDNDGEQ